MTSTGTHSSLAFPSFLSLIRPTDACKCNVAGLTRVSSLMLVARSNYVTREEALGRGLATVQDDSFILRADNTTTLSPGGPGRDSFRIISNNQYGTHVTVCVANFSQISPLRPIIHHHLRSLECVVLIKLTTSTVSTCNTCRRVVGEPVGESMFFYIGD